MHREESASKEPDSDESVSDEELARDCRLGSMAAFDLLVSRYHKRVYGLIHSITRQREEAEDLTQETFLLVIRKISNYDPSRPFGPWLFTLARRCTISAWRQKKTTEPFDPDVHSPSNFDSGKSQDNVTHLWEVARQRLKHKAFTALWLYYREAFSIQEVAQSLEMSESAIKTSLHRSRAELANHLSPEMVFHSPVPGTITPYPAPMP